MAFDMSDYNTVPERLVEFKEKHPHGSLQPADLTKPYEIVAADGRWFVVYVAAAYRTPDDPRPGIGAAWEPFPGTTNYTRNSELQNAETSAWGRAIVACLAADARKGIASHEDVRNRSAESDPSQASAPRAPRGGTPQVLECAVEGCTAKGKFERMVMHLVDRHEWPEGMARTAWEGMAGKAWKGAAPGDATPAEQEADHEGGNGTPAAAVGEGDGGAPSLAQRANQMASEHTRPSEDRVRS